MNATISAEINYLGRMQEHPVAFSFNRDAGNLIFDRQRVELHDARTLPPTNRLDERGFLLAQIPFARTEGKLAEVHVEPLRNAVIEYITRLTGAPKVILVGPFIRHADPALAGPGKTPAYYVHADYTALSFARACEDLVHDDPERERWLTGKRAIYQTWTPISPPPQDSVLTILDRSTLQPDDIVDGTVVVGTPDNPRPHPALLFRHNPRHAWYYVSDMKAGDTIIFLGLDGQDDALPGCPHTAFENPAPGATPRVSAEMRAFIFWG